MELYPTMTDIQQIEADFKLVTLNYFDYEGYGRLKSLLKKYIRFNQLSKNELVLAYPHPRENPEGKTIYHSVFEADQLPESWVEPANNSNGLIVPDDWVADVFSDSGVKVPIKVIPEGTDEWELFPKPDSPFTFLHFDATSENNRKGSKLVLRAFQDVFGNKADVKLIMKGHPNRPNKFKKYPNVDYIFDSLPRDEFVDLTRSAHCFVFPSKGEGFGLPPIEMMAHGVPTIVSDNSAMSQYAEFGIPIRTKKKIPSQYEIWDCDGNWFEPDYEVLKDKMLMVYNNYEAEKERAEHYRKILKNIYNFQDIAQDIVDAVHGFINE